MVHEFFISSLFLTWNCQVRLPSLQGPIFPRWLSRAKTRDAGGAGSTLRTQAVHGCPVLSGDEGESLLAPCTWGRGGTSELRRVVPGHSWWSLPSAGCPSSQRAVGGLPHGACPGRPLLVTGCLTTCAEVHLPTGSEEMPSPQRQRSGRAAWSSGTRSLME